MTLIANNHNIENQRKERIASTIGSTVNMMKSMKRILSAVLTIVLVLSCMTVPAFAVMKKGSRGSDVTWHQKTLNFLGYSCGTADGIYGKRTMEATASFQADYNLSVDGIAGTKTVSKEKALICEIQQLLNELGYGSLSKDGLPGSKTVTALKKFQKSAGLSKTGICDNMTLSLLRAEVEEELADTDDRIRTFEQMCLKNWTLPLKDDFRPITGSRKFGSSRDNGNRQHGGIDFVADSGTIVYAMTSGTVLQTYLFYAGTWAVEVENEDGSIVRYCEIVPSVKAGDRIEQQDAIGTIVRSNENTVMCHIELYYGDCSGALTQRKNKTYTYVENGNYQRRADLLDPTFLIDLEKPE